MRKPRRTKRRQGTLPPELRHYLVPTEYLPGDRAWRWRSLCGIDYGVRAPKGTPTPPRCVVCLDLDPTPKGEA